MACVRAGKDADKETPGSWHLLDRPKCRLLFGEESSRYKWRLGDVSTLSAGMSALCCWKWRMAEEKFLGEKYSCDTGFSKDKVRILLQTVSPVTRWKSLIEYEYAVRMPKRVKVSVTELWPRNYGNKFHSCQPLNSLIERVCKQKPLGVSIGMPWMLTR